MHYFDHRPIYSTNRASAKKMEMTLWGCIFLPKQNSRPGTSESWEKLCECTIHYFGTKPTNRIDRTSPYMEINFWGKKVDSLGRTELGENTAAPSMAISVLVITMLVWNLPINIVYLCAELGKYYSSTEIFSLTEKRGGAGEGDVQMEFRATEHRAAINLCTLVYFWWSFGCIAFVCVHFISLYIIMNVPSVCSASLFARVYIYERHSCRTSPHQSALFLFLFSPLLPSVGVALMPK